MHVMVWLVRVILIKAGAAIDGPDKPDHDGERAGHDGNRVLNHDGIRVLDHASNRVLDQGGMELHRQ